MAAGAGSNVCERIAFPAEGQFLGFPPEFVTSFGYPPPKSRVTLTMRPVCVTTPLTPHRDLDRGSLASLSAYIQAGARREDTIEGAAIVCDVTVASASKENGCCVPKPPLQIAAVSAQAPRGLIAPPQPPAPCPLIRARTEAKART